MEALQVSVAPHPKMEMYTVFDYSPVARTLSCLALGLYCLPAVAGAAPTAADGAADVLTILPGDARIDVPSFDDYEVTYSSPMAPAGQFTVTARKSADGKSLSLIDVIPMQEQVIVAQRQIDLTTLRSHYAAQPYFAWGQEFVVAQSNGDWYDWVRVPVGGGEPIRLSGTLPNGGYFNEMFSPTLAALMPLAPGTRFRLPEAYPRKGGFVSSEFDDYQVLRQETLALDSGLRCECWVVEKSRWGGDQELIWVSRAAPFVLRRVQSVGTERERASEALRFRRLGE